MIHSVHIPIFCNNPSRQAGALLTLKTIRVGFPTLPIHVYWHGGDPTMCRATAELVLKMGLNWHANEIEQTNDKLIKKLAWKEQQGFAVVDSDVVFFDNCENAMFAGLIAGEYIPQFVCPLAAAITYPRLHTAFFVVPEPVKLRTALWQCYKPRGVGGFCPFDAFRPVVTFRDGRPWLRDSCCQLYQAVGGESFGPAILDKFEHLYSGSYADTVSKEHAAFLDTVYADPNLAKGFRFIMQRYFTEHAI